MLVDLLLWLFQKRGEKLTPGGEVGTPGGGDLRVGVGVGSNHNASPKLMLVSLRDKLLQIVKNIPFIRNGRVDNLVLGIRPNIVHPLSVIQHLVDGSNRQHLNSSNLALLSAPEQPGTRLPVLDVAYRDQGSDFGLGVGVVGVSRALLGVQVPVDLGALLFSGNEQLGVVDVVLGQGNGGPEESAVVAVDGLAGGFLVTAAGSVGDTRGPGVACEPVTAAGDGEVGVLGRGVDDVPVFEVRG